MESFRDIFALWKEAGFDFAEDVGVKPGKASIWKHRGKIPDGFWKATATAAAQRAREATDARIQKMFASVTTDRMAEFAERMQQGRAA